MTPSNLPGTATPSGGPVDAVRGELARLHERWMALVFPRQRAVPGSVLGKWKPATVVGRLEYGLWAGLGVPVLAVAYAVALVGSPFRFGVRRVATVGRPRDLAVTTALVGAGATVGAWFVAGPEATRAVGAAAVVAAIALAVAGVIAWRRGRPVTVFAAYPLAVVALGIVPAALVATTTAMPTEVVDAATTRFAGQPLSPALPAEHRPLGTLLAAWTAVGTAFGWTSGVLVTVTDLVRPPES